jgi:hypothetical protein
MSFKQMMFLNVVNTMTINVRLTYTRHFCSYLEQGFKKNHSHGSGQVLGVFRGRRGEDDDGENAAQLERGADVQAVTNQLSRGKKTSTA